MNKLKEFEVIESTDSKKVPKRIAFIKNKVSAKVEAEEKDVVMTFPHLVVKEIIAFEILIIAISIISLLFNAPLEWIASPDHTPNPAKAPWYFLGLQELLHYFPPIVAGVIIPALAAIALIVIPYFRINVKREPVWDFLDGKKLITFLSVIGLLSAVLLVFNAYAILIPTLAMFIFMIISRYFNGKGRFTKWIKTRPFSWWVMTWFVVIVVVLTTIGTLFRGPEWSWTWPWEGIY